MLFITSCFSTLKKTEDNILEETGYKFLKKLAEALANFGRIQILPLWVNVFAVAFFETFVGYIFWKIRLFFRSEGQYRLKILKIWKVLINCSSYTIFQITYSISLFIWNLLTIVAKLSILDVCEVPDHAS